MGVLDSLGSVIGGIAGKEAGAGARGEANNQAQIANNIIQALGDAPDIDKPLILEQYRQAGILTPELEQYITAQVPAAVKTDPKLKEAQMQALKQIQDRATGGLTAADRASLEEANLGAQEDVKSRLASIDSQLQQRGQSDSGTNLAMKLSAAQNGANSQAADARAIAKQSQEARDRALNSLGSLSTQIQGQEFNQGMANQQAQNEMNRFNVGNQTNQQARNVGAKNSAQASNLSNVQNISNANVGNANAELQRQKTAALQEYNANKDTAGLKAGAARNTSAWDQYQGDKQALGAYQTGAGIGQVAQSGVQGITNAFSGGFAEGGKIPNYKHGGEVPGQAPVKGDSPENDIVHAILSPGEIVVPRTISESKFGKHLLKIIDAHNNLKKHMSGED